MHLTFIDCNKVIPFSPYLKKIILDDPMLDDNILFESAKKEIEKFLQIKQIECELQIRHCHVCHCTEKYHSFKSGGIKYRFGIL